MDNLAELAALLEQAAAVVDDLEHSPELGWGELLHEQKRSQLKILLLQLAQETRAHSLQENTTIEVQDRQIQQLQECLATATDETIAVVQRWAAIESIKDESRDFIG